MKQLTGVRHYRKGLIIMTFDGTPCEVCGRPMLQHDWVDLNKDGDVIHCSYADV